MTLEEGIRGEMPRAAELIAGLSAGQINWRPAENSWSIAECIEHMNTLNGRYADAIGQAIAAGRDRGQTGKGEVPLGLLERWFLQTIEPPYRLKFKAPLVFRPQGSNFNADDLLGSWQSTHERLVELTRAAHGVDMKRVKVPSPATPVLKISLQLAFRIIPAHDRRHLWQAKRVRLMLPQANRSAM